MATPNNQNTKAAFIHSRLDDLGLTAVQFRVYCHIQRRAGDEGKFFESVPNCAAFCQVKPITLRAAMKRLLALGLIQIVAAPPGRTWTYRVTPMEEWKFEPLPNENPGPQMEGVGNSGHKTEVNPVPQTVGANDTAPKAGTGSGSLKGEGTPPKAGTTKVLPEGNPMKGDRPPTFEPLLRPLYRGTGQAMIRDAEAAIKAVKEKRENYARDLSKAAEGLIAWLETEKQPGWEAKAKAIYENPESYERKNLKPIAAAIVQAWRERIEEIKRAMAGITN